MKGEEKRESIETLPDDLVEEAKIRMLSYSTLASFFHSELTTALLEQFRLSPPSMEGKLGDFFSELPEKDIEAVRSETASDFAAVFLGMSASPVAPYESVYTSEEHLLMQDARDEVLALYRQMGFKYVNPENIPEDHAATEFEFMAKLCEMEAEVLEAGDTQEAEKLKGVQRTFVNDHLMRWIPRFCDDIECRASTVFYQGLAELTREVVLADAEYLKD